jgi:hypothetical protein
LSVPDTEEIVEFAPLTFIVPPKSLNTPSVGLQGGTTADEEEIVAELIAKTPKFLNFAQLVSWMELDAFRVPGPAVSSEALLNVSVPVRDKPPDVRRPELLPVTLEVPDDVKRPVTIDELFPKVSVAPLRVNLLRSWTVVATVREVADDGPDRTKLLAAIML